MPIRARRFLAAPLAALALAACQTTPGGVLPDAPAEDAKLGLDGALRLGEAARAGGDYASAVRILEMATSNFPTEIAPRQTLADTYFDMGALPEADKAYRDLVAMEAGRAGPLVGLGRVALARGEPEAAERHFAAALAVEPGNLAAMNGRAVAADLLGRHAEAIRLYDAILADDPTNRAVMTNRALSIALAGDRSTAMALLEGLSSGPAALPQARHNLALVAALSGDETQAAELMRRDLPERQVQENLAFYGRLR
jgi:Flp pilus assembly protein TadD